MKLSLTSLTWTFVLICVGFWLLLGVAQQRREAAISPPSHAQIDPGLAQPESVPVEPGYTPAGPGAADPGPADADDESEPAPFIIQ